MKKSKFTVEPIAFALRQAEAGTPVEQACRNLASGQATCSRWKKQGEAIRRPRTHRIEAPPPARGGEPLRIVRTPKWDDDVCLAVSQIRLFGAGSLQVPRRLRAMLEHLIEVRPGPHPARLRCVRNWTCCTMPSNAGTRNWKTASVRRSSIDREWVVLRC